MGYEASGKDAKSTERDERGESGNLGNLGKLDDSGNPGDPQSNASPISRELDELTCDAIGMALDKLAGGEGIWPTVVLLDENGARERLTFEDDGLDVCLVQARGYVSKMSPATTRCYVLLYDGFFEDAEGATDGDGATRKGTVGAVGNALVAEFAERGAPCAYSAVVPYGFATGRQVKDGADAFWYDEALPGGEEENLLGDADAEADAESQKGAGFAARPAEAFS